MAELLVNLAHSELNGAIDGTETTITVVDGSVFPATGNFRVTVEDEIMLCTARSVHDLTVTRGHESTANVAHVSGEAIVHTLTKGGLDQYALENWKEPWQIILTPLGYEPQSASYATLDVRNNHPILDFDADADEAATWTAFLPAAYAGGGVDVKVIWAATTATSGTVRWRIGFERIAASALDIDGDSFATENSGGSTADGVSGETVEFVLGFTDGAQMDNLSSGEMFRIKVARDADGGSGTDDMTGDAELLMVVITEQ